jgi:hypothetical protein
MIYFLGKTFALQMSPTVGFFAFTDVDLLYSSAVITISLGYILMMYVLAVRAAASII